MQLTPQLAAHWLKLNHQPKPPRPEKIDAYAADMTRGRWGANTIIDFDNGRLTDGKHRCAAVIASGVTIEVRLRVRSPPWPPLS